MGSNNDPIITGIKLNFHAAPPEKLRLAMLLIFIVSMAVISVTSLQVHVCASVNFLCLVQ